MNGVTLQQLQCFDAVVREGSFQAAAERLHRTHPAIFSAIKNLEEQLGIALLNRDGYRVALTNEGRAFHERARAVLNEFNSLQSYAEQLATGKESELRVVIGDLCPFPQTLGLLRRFFDSQPATRLHLFFETLAGPWERLFDGDAHLIIHHIDKSDSRLEFVDLATVNVVPVVAPGFLSFPVTDHLTPAQMRPFPQCVIRDSAQHSATPNYFVMEGARSWTVSDQFMKKEIIVQGMGWGHMPHFLIADELKSGRLISIAGKHFPGGRQEIVAARRRDAAHGPVAQELWRHFAESTIEID